MVLNIPVHQNWLYSPHTDGIEVLGALGSTTAWDMSLGGKFLVFPCIILDIWGTGVVFSNTVAVGCTGGTVSGGMGEVAALGGRLGTSTLGAAEWTGISSVLVGWT